MSNVTICLKYASCGIDRISAVITYHTFVYMVQLRIHCLILVSNEKNQANVSCDQSKIYYSHIELTHTETILDTLSTTCESYSATTVV